MNNNLWEGVRKHAQKSHQMSHTSSQHTHPYCQHGEESHVFSYQSQFYGRNDDHYPSSNLSQDQHNYKCYESISSKHDQIYSSHSHAREYRDDKYVDYQGLSYNSYESYPPYSSSYK